MPYIPRAVRSTLASLPRDAELVVLDDASTDDSFEWLSAVSDPRMRLLRHAESSGVGGSLNALLDASDSTYVARMDADDVCLPWRFVRQLRSIARSDITFTAVVFIDERGIPSRPDLPGRISPAAVPLHLLLGNFLVHPTMLARREALQSLGGYSKTGAEDYDLWLRAARAGLRIERTAVPGLLYRRHGTQLSATGSWLDQANDPLLDESFGGLLEQRLDGTFADAGLIRFARVTGRASAMCNPDAKEFQRAMRAASANLPRLQKLLLATRMRAIE